MDHLNVWEAVDGFNQRSAAGRVVVNPPSKRGKVKAFPTQETWCLCRCGRAFSCTEKYVEHKLSHEAVAVKASVKLSPGTTKAIFKKYSSFRIKKENGRLVKSCKTEILTTTIKKRDHVISRFDEDNVRLPVNKVKVEAKSNKRKVSFKLKPEEYPSKTKQVITVFKEAKEVDKTVAPESKRSSSIKPSRRNAVPGYQSDKVYTRPTALNPTVGKQCQVDQNKDCQNPDLQTGAFKCEICQLIIRTQIGLFRHRVVKHKGEGVLRCKICKYCFASLHALQVHMRRFHRGTNPCKINTRLNGSKLMNIRPGDNRGVHELLGGKNERKRKTSIDTITCDVVLDDGGGSHPSENQNENDFQYKFSNFKGTRSGAPNKSPNYQCLKCCKIFLSAGLLRRHNISKHPDSVTAIQGSYCVKCDKPCGGTCTVQRSRSSTFLKKSQNGIRSRLVSLRSSARKPTREASSNATNSSLIDVNQRTTTSPISEAKSPTKEKRMQAAQVEKELSVENLRSLPSPLVESQPKVPEEQLENKPIFYDAVGTRTRSKNSTENAENASLATSDKNNEGSIGTPLSLNKFVCKFCGLQRGSIKSVVQHIRWHHSRKPFRRQLANSKAKYKPNAFSSRNSKCSGTDSVLDKDDSTVGLKSSSTPVLTGEKIDDRVECKTCRVMIRRSRYDQHLLSQTHLKVKFECVICSRRYMYQSWLKAHMRTHGHVACDKCDKTFQYPSMLKLHKRSHERELKQKRDCETSGEEYKEQSALTANKTAVHGIVDANGESLKDETCGKKDRPARLLRFHKQADSTSTSNSFECDICHVKLKSARNLRFHLKSCHVIGGKFPCSVCPCVLGSLTSLIAHTRKRHKLMKNPSLENDCNTTIVAQNSDADKLNKSSLSSEVTLQNSLKVDCEKCGFSVSKYGYAKHLKVAHVESGKFPCISCSCVFGSQLSLQIHKQRQHYQERKIAETSLGENGIANASTANASTASDISASTASDSTASASTASTRPRRNSDLPRKNYGKSVSILSEPNNAGMLNSTPTAINCITCTLCKLSIPGSSPEMAVHKKTAHVKNSEYGCNYCSCAFKDDHGLKLHLSTVIHTSTSEDKNEKLLHVQKNPAIKRMETKTEGQRRTDSIRSKKISRLATNTTIPTHVNTATRVSTRNSVRSVRRKMFSSSLFPSKITTTTTNNTEDAVSYLSSTITSPIFAQNYQQLFPPDLFTTDNVIKPEIINANSDSDADASFPVIVNCFSQNPEYLKKHSPQKTESEIITTTKSSRISKLSSKFKLPSNQQNPTNDELIRKSAAMSASSIIWSPPKRTTISSQKSMATNRASLAIQNLLADQSLTIGGSVSGAVPKILDVRSLSRSESPLNREKRVPVSVETSMFTSPVTRSLLGSPPANADDNIFKVPLPPRPTRSKSGFTIVSSTSNSLTASVADRTRRIETIGTSSSFQPQQPVTQARGLNNFIFPSLNLDQPSSAENALVRRFSTDSPSVPSNPSIVRVSPTPTATVTPTDTYIHNYQQSSHGPTPTVSFPQTSFVSSLLPKFQNKKPCPFVANPKTQASKVFESQRPIYSDCGTFQDPVIQNQLSFSTSTIEDKDSNGPIRARLVTCNICTKSFFGQTKLSNHMKIHEADNLKEMTPQKPKPGGKCGYCGETFIIHNALWAHLKVCSSAGAPASSSVAVNGFL